MNRKLFEIRNLGRKPIIWIIVILLFLFSSFFVYQLEIKGEDNFLKFHGKSDYSPLTTSQKGFYGKVNKLLQEALENRNNIQYDITKLDSVYKQLRFYYPTDTADYLVSVDDIRLIDFIPIQNDNSTLAFYLNSDFKNLIEKQKKNLTQKYFNIEWNKAKSRIIRITVDTTLFNLSLQNDSWKGLIKYKDPFAEVDPNVKYLITEGNIVPLFSSNVDSIHFFNSENSWINIDPRKIEKYSLNEYESIFTNLNCNNSDSSKTIRLNYHIKENENEFSIRFLNTGDKIFIQTQLIDIQIYGEKKLIQAFHDTTVAISSNFGILKISLQLRGISSKYTVYISNVPPFTIASKPLNEGVTRERLHIDPNYLDLFSLQQLRQLESGISNKDSIATVELSTNIILSKYLEQKIKETVISLSKDRRFCQRPDDVFEMSVCLMDIATGEIIASPFYSNEFEKNNIDEVVYQRNFNLARHDIGSAFKPLITFAAYLKYKSLSDFQLLPTSTFFIADTACMILGYRTLGYGFNKKTKIPNKLFWSSDIINRQVFLSKSHDNFPIALSMLALTERKDHTAYNLLTTNHLDNLAANNLYQINSDVSSRILYKNDNKRIVFDNISNSSFINLISNLYSVESENNDSTYNTITYDTHSWDGLKTKRKIFYSLYPDIVYLGTDQFGNVNSDLADFKKFELFVLGQGDNLWSNVKLAEAYSRLLSKHKVSATFLKNGLSLFPSLFEHPVSLFQSKSNNHYQFNVTTADMNNTWTSFMNDWRIAVQMDNPLLKTAYDNFQNGVTNYSDYHFYCKTGTPQENNEHVNNKVFKKGKLKVWWDEGVFVFGITDTNINYPKGIVGVVYIKHLSLDKIDEGVESSTARDFFQPEIFKMIMFCNQNRFNQ